MKSKIFLFGLTCVLLFSLNACKSKQSAYRAAFEAAQEREMQEETKITTAKPKPVSTTSESNETFQREKVTAVDSKESVRPYSVVIGSFLNKTNAVSLKERMQAKGYKPILAQNEKGMYRVIIATFNDRSSAVVERENVKSVFAPDFQDAWLLQNEN
jgi:cell division protein FtsN